MWEGVRGEGGRSRGVCVWEEGREREGRWGTRDGGGERGERGGQ